MTFIHRRINADATSWRCIDVNATLHKRQVPAGKKTFQPKASYGSPSRSFSRRSHYIYTLPSRWSRFLTGPINTSVRLGIRTAYEGTPAANSSTTSQRTNYIRSNISEPSHLDQEYLQKNMPTGSNGLKYCQIYTSIHVRNAVMANLQLFQAGTWC